MGLGLGNVQQDSSGSANEEARGSPWRAPWRDPGVVVFPVGSCWRQFCRVGFAGVPLALVTLCFEGCLCLSSHHDPDIEHLSFLFWGKCQSTREKKELMSFREHEFLVTPTQC